MKRRIVKAALWFYSLAVSISLAPAQPANQLGNGDFESPAFGKITNYSLAFPWQNDGVNYTNTGLEDTGAHSGTYRAFEMSGDDGAYQITSYQLQSGDTISLSWFAMGTYNGTSTTFPGTGTNDPLQIVGLLKASSTAAAFGATSTLAIQSNGVPGGAGWIQYTLNYTATPSDAGNFVGAYFNTQRVLGNDQGSFGAYDDFYLAVLPAGSPPAIVTQPSSQTAFTGANVQFTVSAIGATGYRWMAGVTGSGIYTNLSNGGQFSGVTSATLTITNVTPTNNADFVVVVSNGNGSVTSSPPANLTVATIIYRENFNVPTTPDQSVTNVGWRNDLQGANNRIFTGNIGVVFPNCAVYSFVGNATNEAFYATTATANGSISNHMAFPGINLATVQNLSFNVDLNTGFNGNLTHSYIAVQMNFGSWYVSTSELLPQPSSTAFVTHTLIFNPSASAWNQLTLSGNGGLNSVYPIIGPAAAATLTGYITGVGIVCTHDGSSTVDFDNYIITGAIPPTALPVINSPPFGRTNYTGETATFTVSATTNGSTAGLTYQWRAGTVGSGIYVNLSNGGQFSGVNSSTLVISNVTSAANHKDYVVVVTDGAGSVTSTPPATLTVVDSVPLLVNSTTIYPDAATGFSAANAAIHAGNNNVMTFTAGFIGDLPINYQWKVSPNADGSSAVNVPGTTNRTLTLSNPQTNNSGYYSLQASNSQSVTPTNSPWVQFTVLPASTAFIQWSAAAPINGQTAAQILGGPVGTFFEAESFGAGAPISVTNGSIVFLFDNTGTAATVSGGVGTKNGVYTGPTTGDANLDAVLNVDTENGGGSVVTLNNLTIGQLYSAQLIALNDVAGAARQANFSDPNDPADVSPSFAMGDNVYMVGTFTATNSTQSFVENEADGHGYMSAVVVRTVPLTPTLSIQKVGSNVQITYTNGILLQAASLAGPWTTNSNPSPVTISPTGTTLFFRARSP